MILVSCESFDFILRIVGFLFSVLQFVIPIFLIALITFDVVKAMISGDEKGRKDAMGKIGKRLLYAAILFFIPVLVRVLFRAVDKANISGYGNDDNSAIEWIRCFNENF